ncbi:MAG: hypothetical protein QG640_475 [Patescibacteria group bacterium]|nr:hypothetical protein [Patescibacteria group bacterium]
MIILLLLIVLTWFFWLLYSFRSDFKKIAYLVIGVLLQFFGAYLIFQDGIRSDEQGAGGNIFGNPTALLLIGVGFIIVVILTGASFTKKSTQVK